MSILNWYRWGSLGRLPVLQARLEAADSLFWKYWWKTEARLVFCHLALWLTTVAFWVILTRIQAMGGRLGCARLALLPFVGAISQDSWSCFFSFGSCIDHFSFICKVEERARMGRRTTELIQRLFSAENGYHFIPRVCCLFVFSFISLPYPLPLMLNVGELLRHQHPWW